MTKEKNVKYKKAYVELNEIFKVLSKEQRDKIPESFINNISNNMDKNYSFEFDMSKGIFQQKLMVETEALLVEIYEKYLAPEREKEKWKEYDELCLTRINEEKTRKYDVDVFKKKDDIPLINNIDAKSESNNIAFPIQYKKENFFNKIIKYFKTLLNKKNN